MCHTASYYYVGKDPTFTFGTALPFGFNQRMMTPGCSTGGGAELMNDFYKKYNIIAFPPAIPARRWAAGSARRSRVSEDLKGLKMRIGGFAGRVLAKLGVVPQQLAGGDIYPALEKGTIDAAEWVGPYDDEKLGFQKVAPYYYYPGWWEGGPMLHNFVNIGKWNELPKSYQSIVQSASHVANTIMMANYDAGNPAALRRLVAAGAQLRSFPQPVMEACFKCRRTSSMPRLSANNADFKKMLDSLCRSATTSICGGRSPNTAIDSFMIRARARS